MEILLWLVPPIVVTLIAMAWVTWLGREGRGELDPEESTARMGRALSKDFTPRYAPRAAPARDRSTGVAVRPSRVTRRPGCPEPDRDRFAS